MTAASRLDAEPSGAEPHKPYMPRMSKWLFTSFVEAADAASVLLSSLLAYAFFGREQGQFPLYFVVTVLGTVFSVLLFRNGGLYRFDRIPLDRRSARTLAVSWLYTFSGLAVLAFMLRLDLDLSRGWAVAWFIGGGTALVLARCSAAVAYRRCVAAGTLAHTIVLLGGGKLGTEFIKRLHDNEMGIRILGFFDDRRDRVPAEIENIHWLGDTQNLVSFVQNHPVDMVVVALPLAADHRIIKIVSDLKQYPVNIRILPDFLCFHAELLPDNVFSSDLPGMLLLPIANRPISGWSAVAKAIEDRVVAGIALLLFSPLMLLIAIAIRLDSPGPALYRQPRVGYRNQDFWIYKFRTMRKEASVPTPDKLTQRNDPRITRLGNILRKSSLDELPQLLNVLRGEMSVIGPRPHMRSARAEDKLYYEAVAEYAARHRVKPGMSGWAQVNGWRGPTETLNQIQKRVDHDIYYIENWSIGFDFWIMFLTVFRGFIGKNAY